MHPLRGISFKLASVLVFIVLSAFVVYATWAAFQGDHYTYGPEGEARTVSVTSPASVTCKIYLPPKFYYSDDFIDFFADLGLGMLFFFAGYEIDFERIRGRLLSLVDVALDEARLRNSAARWRRCNRPGTRCWRAMPPIPAPSRCG